MRRTEENSISSSLFLRPLPVCFVLQSGGQDERGAIVLRQKRSRGQVEAGLARIYGDGSEGPRPEVTIRPQTNEVLAKATIKPSGGSHLCAFTNAASKE